MKIKCPQCQKVFNAPDTYIGKKVKCLKCNHSFIVNPPIDKQQGETITHLFPLILLGVVSLLIVSVFLYLFPFGRFFKFSQKNVVVSGPNNVPLIKNTGSVNSLDKQPLERSVRVERKTEKIEKAAQVLKADINAAAAESNAVEHNETVPILNPVIDNHPYPTDESKILPTLYSVLDDDRFYFTDVIMWHLWSLYLEHPEVAKKKPDEFLIKKDNVIEMLNRINSSDYPLLFSYKKEIVNLIQGLDFDFLNRNDVNDKEKIPIRFASLESKPVIIIGNICSDVIFNNVNTLLNTPKKRASAFIQKKVLPDLLNAAIISSLYNTDFKYIGLVYIYGNRNFVNEEIYSSAESLCIVIPLKDYSSFAKRELSQEEFLKKCLVFLKSEGANFIKVELVLD